MKVIWNKFRRNGCTNGETINDPLLNFLRLLRIPNLFILTSTLWIVTKCIIYPPLIAHRLAPLFTNKEFYLLLFIIVCLGAGGYVHNDIVDLRSDTINSKRGFVGVSISKSLTYLIYIFLTFGPLLPLYSLSMEVNHPEWIMYYLFLAFIFWTYNRVFKRYALIGNLIVAGLCGLAVLIPYIIDYQTLKELHAIDVRSFNQVTNRVFAFTFFCFAANLIREIVKDIEDVKGDAVSGLKTLPLLIGKEKTRWVVFSLNLIMLLLVSTWIVTNHRFPGYLLLILSVLLAFPLVFLLVRTWHARTTIHFNQLSYYWKIYLLTGLLSLWLISYQ